MNTEADTDRENEASALPLNPGEPINTDLNSPVGAEEISTEDISGNNFAPENISPEDLLAESSVLPEGHADPIPDFSSFDLNPQLLNALKDLGFTEPSEIQRLAIPVLSAGHDLLGVAQTGTGKTAAYLLPLLMKVKYAQGENPRALIVTPTRELAIQVETQIGQLAKYLDIRFTAVYGGLGPKTQIAKIAAGLDILVATPGRLLELYLNGHLILKELKTLVLDEADKMMDMGFMPQIRNLLEVIPNKRQNVLMSATMPNRVMRLADEFLLFPVRVEATPDHATAANVEQVVYETPNRKTKLNLILYLLSARPEMERVFLFVKTRTDADSISKFLDRKIQGSVRVIHANKGQNARINAMEAFREGDVRVLVATDVAARGLDINGVTHVVNFDVPVVLEDYVHRIGRTGRARALGSAYTFVHKADEYHMARIEKIIKMQVPRLPMPNQHIIEKTPFDEEQEYLLAIDNQRKREDPTFQGAFHEKKARPGQAVAPKKAGTAAKAAKAPGGTKGAFKGPGIGGYSGSNSGKSFSGNSHEKGAQGKKFSTKKAWTSSPGGKRKK